MTDFVTYPNTAENARDIGWALLPEYCEGDLNAPCVTHDTVRGIFVFHQ